MFFFSEVYLKDDLKRRTIRGRQNLSRSLSMGKKRRFDFKDIEQSNMILK